jgi:hypothetical protein
MQEEKFDAGGMPSVSGYVAIFALKRFGLKSGYHTFKDVSFFVEFILGTF